MGEPECGEAEGWLPADDPRFKPYVLVCISLVITGGIMSGLQQGLMQLDRPMLRTMKREASPLFVALLRFVEPLVERRHLTLVTLLISNAAAMESLPIFFDSLVPKYAAIIFSVSLLLIFGEIIPQALCLKWPGEIACIFAPLVWFLMALFFPIAYPISRLLDWMLGTEHGLKLSRAGLKEIAQESSRVLSSDELEVITGALDLWNKVTSDVCLPLDQCFMLSYDAVLTDKILREILDHGHSRVPVYRGSRENIVGLLLVKHLIRVDPMNAIKVSDLQVMPIFVVDKSVSLFALLRRFRTGASHMAVVVNENPMARKSINGQFDVVNEDYERVRMGTTSEPADNVVGLLTLEDVIEQLLKHDISDETDVWKPVNDKLDLQLRRVKGLREDLTSVLSKALQFQSPTKSNASSHSNSDEESGLIRHDSAGSKQHRRLTYGSLNDFERGSNGSSTPKTGLQQAESMLLQLATKNKRKSDEIAEGGNSKA